MSSGNAEATPQRPLAGVRVLALEQMQSLPWATQLLARLGADVVKIENPISGDTGRASDPSIVDPQGRKVGATFLRSNMNKRSVTIDLKNSEGQSLIKSLLPHFDIVCENFRPGVIKNFGLDYNSLADELPKLIYLSISGFGNEGDSPYRSWPAFASIAEAMAGIYEFAKPANAPPTLNPVPGMGDTVSGMFSVIGILAALRHRDITGVGQYIDISMLDAMLALGDYPHNIWSLGLRPEPDSEIVLPVISGAFRALDGWFIVQVYREYQFERFAKAIGNIALLSDERMANRMNWGKHLDDVIRPAVDSWSSGKTKLQCCEILAAFGVAAAPSFQTEDLLVDDHVAKRNMLIKVPKPDDDNETFVVAGNPIKMSNVEDSADRRVPWLGEHTEDILKKELGLSAHEILALRERGVIS